MYRSGRQTTTTTPSSSPGGTQYFNHYPTNFLKPYGLANSAPNHDMLMRKINPKSCEWLKRPKIAVSEFSETMVANMEWLAQSRHTFLNTEKINELKENMEPLLDSLRPLNTKSPNPNPRTQIPKCDMSEVCSRPCMMRVLQPTNP